MKNNKKRLLKDLPFNIKAGNVITKGSIGHGGKYYIHNGDTIYSTGGSSSNGIGCFENNEEDILDAIWDNKDWFEDLEVPKIDIKINRGDIVISFKPLDLEQAQNFGKGIKKCLEEFYTKSSHGYTYSEFDGFIIKSLT